jgi:broad specificity phosphatase PhoE
MHSTVWLVRHAHRLDFIQPEWFETALFPYDPPLSALGWQQSLELVPKLRNSHIQQIFTSPYLRTIQTAYPIAQSLGLLIQIEDGLKEWLNPSWSTSLPKTLPVKTLIDQGFPIDSHYLPQILPTYPETITELTIRAATVARKIITQSISSTLIVAHKHTLTAIVASLTGNVATAYPWDFAPAEFMVLTTTDRSSGSWQITSHD